MLVGALLLAASLSGQEQAPYPRLPAPPVKSPPDTTAPDIPGVVVGGTKVHLIRDLFQSTEGPIAMPDGSLLFTEQDAGDGRLVKIDSNGNISTFVDNTNRTIGLAYDPKGRLIGTSRIPRVGVLNPVRISSRRNSGRPAVAPTTSSSTRKWNLLHRSAGRAIRPVPPGRPGHDLYIRPRRE